MLKQTPGNTGEEIYRRFLDGDKNALEELIGLYKVSLTLFLYGIVGDMSDAEDLMLDVFARLVTSRTRFEGKSSLKTYLFAAGKNHALRHMKKRKHEKHLSFEEAVEAIGTDEHSPEINLLRYENKRQLYKAMQKLKPEHREVLFLIYFEDMSYADTAKVLKKTETQVSSLAYRAKASLKRTLESEGFIYAEQ